MREYVVQFFQQELFWQFVIESDDIENESEKFLQQYLTENGYNFQVSDFTIITIELDRWLTRLRERGKCFRQ